MQQSTKEEHNNNNKNNDNNKINATTKGRQKDCCIHVAFALPSRMRLQSGSVRRKPLAPTPAIMSSIRSFFSRSLGLRDISCNYILIID